MKMDAAPVSNPVVTRVYRSVLAMLFLLGVFLPLLDWRFAFDRTPELTENRTLAAAPSWPTDIPGLKALPNALESYWNDAFGFRRKLLRWNAIAQFELGISPSSLVVIGKHPWLFYTGNDSMEQHRGLRPFSDGDLANWAEKLEQRRAWLAARGSHFLFVVAPDKQTIYPDAVPDRYGPTGRTPLDQLMDYLSVHSKVDVLDLRPPVRAARAEGDVYNQTDSHWNDRGAYAGYVAIMNRLRVWYPAMQARTPESFQRHVVGRWDGDLTLLMGSLYDVVTETGEHWLPDPQTSAQEVPAGDFHPAESIVYAEFEDPEHKSSPRAVVIHDSFLLAVDERRVPGQPYYPGQSLRPETSTFRPREMLAEHFSHAAFSWQYSFDPTIIEHEHPDVVIEEHAERFIRSGPEGEVPAN